MHYLFANALSPTQEIRSSFVSTSLFRKYAVKGNTSCVLSSLPLSAPFHFCRAQNCARQVPLTFFSWALPLSVAATLPPQTHLRSAKAVVFIGVSPLLIVMLACGSLRANRAVTIFAIRHLLSVASFQSFVPHSFHSATFSNPRKSSSFTTLHEPTYLHYAIRF